MQVAAAMEAEVTSNCTARNADMVAALGASRVIDYGQQDFTQQAVRYDVIFDILGVSSYAKARRSLARSGRYVCPVLGLGLLGAMMRATIAGMRQQLSIGHTADVANVEDRTNSVRNCDSERSGSRIGAICPAPSLMCKALLPRAQLNQPCTKELQTCRSTKHSLFF